MDFYFVARCSASGDSPLEHNKRRSDEHYVGVQIDSFLLRNTTRSLSFALLCRCCRAYDYFKLRSIVIMSLAFYGSLFPFSFINTAYIWKYFALCICLRVIFLLLLLLGGWEKLYRRRSSWNVFFLFVENLQVDGLYVILFFESFVDFLRSCRG